MSNIISLPSPHTFMRIDVGMWREPGTSGPGTRTFWLEYVEADGSTFIIWSGESYGEALKAAAPDQAGGMRLVDLVASGGTGGAA